MLFRSIEEAKGSDRLRWEKELLGVYAMSHPLNHVSVDLRNMVSCYCNELDERYNGKNVLLAGMIAGVRTINTKKGDQMAFVQLEDMAGQCEVVVFPRTYAEVKELLSPDTVVVVKGKAQTREGQTSLLADSIQNYVDVPVSIGPDPTERFTLRNEGPTINGQLHDTDDTFNGTGALDPDGDGDDGAGYGNAVYGGPVYDGDADVAYNEENPFRNEPPSWLADDVAQPAELDAPKETEAMTNPAGHADPEPAPDNPYLHESRSLRDEAEVEIGLPKSLREQPPALVHDPVDGTAQDDQDDTEEPAPDNPYLHESRNLRDEGEVEIGLPAFLQNDPTFDPDSLTEGAEGETEEDAAGDTANDTVTDMADGATPASMPAASLEPVEGSEQPAGHTNGHANVHTNGHANDHANSHTNGHANGSGNGNGRGNGNNQGNGHGNGGAHPMSRALHIVFRPSGEFDRDKFRLKQICETVRDPKGRDRFYIEIKGQRKVTKLAFPNDPCSISDRLQQELHKFFRVEVRVEE